MSLDANGLCVVKKVIMKFKQDEKKEMVYKALSENCMALVQSPFGNYAIQTAIETGSRSDCKDIYASLLKNVLQLSMQKFSSNVIEKCIEFSDDETRQEFVQQLSQPEVMKTLIKNNYGFYVV